MGKLRLMWVLCALFSYQMVFAIVAGAGRQVVGNIVRRSVATLARSMEQHQVVPDVVDTAPANALKV